MKTVSSALLAYALSAFCSVFGQSTAFVYQGRLDHAGAPANGLYEMSFALHDAVTNGNLVGTPTTVAPVLVSNGLFTATLDFGAGAFTGADRWLEIGVTVFGSDQPVVTLQPRQPLTPAPYALHAANAAGLTSFNSAPLEIKANGQRVLRLEANPGEAPNIIGGASVNGVAAGVLGATIGGGGTSSPGFEATNRVEANYGTISGGAAHTIRSLSRNSTISGGWQNTIHAESGWSTIGGGEANTVERNARYSTVGGGGLNRAGGYGSVIGGGSLNTVQTNSEHSTIGGGGFNRILRDSSAATIGGGYGNQVSQTAATVGGGNNNVASAINATVAGGSINSATGRAAFIGGGGGEDEDGANFPNLASGRWSVVTAGAANSALGDYAAVGGGLRNWIAANATPSTIGGGNANTNNGESATIGGGFANSAISRFATVVGGAETCYVESWSGASRLNHAAQQSIHGVSRTKRIRRTNP